MSQNHRKQVGGPRVEEGFPLWRNQSASRRNRLLEFRAGKMFVRENMVHPDTRKGIVYIYQDDEGVMHFCWMDRSRGVAEDDILTMPADCSFKRIEKCTTGRVYLLKMKSSNRTLFFWMQEPSTANDLHICNKVNSLLNFPPPRMMFPEQIFNNELQFILNQLNSEQLHALYNGDDIVWVDARNHPPDVEQTNGPPPPPSSPPPPAPFVNLGEVVNEESIKTILKNPGLMKRLEGKMPSIEGDQRKNLEDTVKSYTFKHAIEDFSLALKHGTSGQTLRELNVNAAAIAAADKGDVDSFIKALQGGVVATFQKKGGSPSGPGNSGSSSRKPKDPSTGNSEKDGQGSRKESTQQEELNSNNKQANEEPRKRNCTAFSTGTIKVNSAQQTEPIIITSLIQSVGPELKVVRKLAQLSIQGSNDFSHEKCQNTDPVHIEEQVVNANNTTYDIWAPCTSNINKLGSSEQSIEQTEEEVTSVTFGDKSGSVEPPTPVNVEKAHNQIKISRNYPIETTNPNEFPNKMDRRDDIKLNSEEETIKLVNDNERKTNTLLGKRMNVNMDESDDINNNRKRIKFDEHYSAKEKLKQVQHTGSDGNNSVKKLVGSKLKENEETKELSNDLNCKPTKRLHADEDGTNIPDSKMMKFDSHMDKELKVGSTEHMLYDDSDRNERSVQKVEGEQQTEPVRIKSAPSTGAERKVTTKRASARGQRLEGNMERSQNTDPVFIEEKQKRQSKPKDRKPPGQQ